MVMAETFLKASILTQGVLFSGKALEYACAHHAKKQNMVYNAPVGSDALRPQELFIKHADGYETVVSCVAPCKNNPVQVDVIDQKIAAYVDGNLVHDVAIEFVPEPHYYKIKLNSGEWVKDYVSACGYDELNILPWKGCAISSSCLFCGANVVANEMHAGKLTAYNISTTNIWEVNGPAYLNNLKEAIKIAMHSTCYDQHMHVILISGDLCDDKLDMQAEIYSQIAAEINPLIENKSSEGIIAVMMPPKNRMLIGKIKESGISTVVFNLEVSDEKLFNVYCPGKKNIGYRHIIDSLVYAADVFGKGSAWSNFVFGLEPIDTLLSNNYMLADKGIVSSANVLHLDKGNRLDCQVPDYTEVIRYYYELSNILKEFHYSPFYCAKALRTSLSNEAFEGRIVL